MELARPRQSRTLPFPEAAMASGLKASDDWRRDLDFPGFAQEFLRRNPAYRADYKAVMSGPLAEPASEEVMARRWGLCFPL